MAEKTNRPARKKGGLHRLPIGFICICVLPTLLLIGVMVIVIGCSVSVVMTKPLKRLAKSVRDVHDGYENDFKGIDTYTETAAISAACHGMLRRRACRMRRHGKPLRRRMFRMRQTQSQAQTQMQR